jgi:hypothetical protein
MKVLSSKPQYLKKKRERETEREEKIFHKKFRIKK